MKHQHGTVKGVALVLESKDANLGHPVPRKYTIYGLSRLDELLTVEKLFDFRNNIMV